MARRGKHADKESDAESLPELTPKQQAFVYGLSEGKTASDAYRAAYNTERMNERSIWREAGRLRADPKVSTWLLRFRMAALASGHVNVEQHLAELTRLRELAIANGHISAAVQAENARGKVCGLYEEKIRLIDETSNVELLAALQAQLGDDVAATIAERMGLELVDEDGPTKH